MAPSNEDAIGLSLDMSFEGVDVQAEAHAFIRDGRRAGRFVVCDGTASGSGEELRMASGPRTPPPACVPPPPLPAMLPPGLGVWSGQLRSSQEL